MNKYDLWLDESGTFDKEDQITRNRYPSLVGGILIQKGLLTDSDITRLVGQSMLQQRSHGTTMSRRERHEVMVPALKEIVERGGHLVIFENREHIDYYENRDLYLRMLAGGLLRLLEKLSADGEFQIDICIAKRLVVSDNSRKIIEDEEYLSILKSFILEGWHSHTFDIENECRINISVQDARFERRLQLADYACNARFTMEAAHFSASDRNILRSLYDHEYSFGIKSYAPEHRLLTSLAVRDISGALYTYAVSRELMSRKKMKNAIMRNVKKTSFYLLRDTINDFTEDIIHLALRDNDFEKNEAVLKRILDDIFPEIEKIHPGLQIDVAKFRVLLCLSDMYLREGDIGNAGKIIDRMTLVIRSMNYCIENLKWVYFYNDKLALYQINLMEYNKAVSTITKTIDLIETMRDVLDLNDDLKNYFGNVSPVSSYLGNAYTMRIYAKLFIQRSEPGLYEESLKADSDRALSEYHFMMERERNQQYRAFMEMTEGRCRDALNWLFATAEIYDEDKSELKEKCTRYLDYAEKENDLSREYFMLYYVCIMLTARQREEPELPDTMYEALLSQHSMYEEILSPESRRSGIRSDDPHYHRVYEDFLFNRLGIARRNYHPREDTLWRFASFVFISDIGRSKAFEYYDRAIEICDMERSEYVGMQITAIAIASERLANAVKGGIGVSERTKYEKNLVSRLGKLRKRKDLSPKMLEYISEVEQCMEDFSVKLKEEPEAISGRLIDLSEKILF